MDPLTLLQDYASRDGLDKVRLAGARVEFEDSYTFPRDTLTAYRGRQGKGDFYSLATLLVFLRNGKVKLAEYIATAKSLNVPTVHFVDRKVRPARMLCSGACPSCPPEHLCWV